MLHEIKEHSWFLEGIKYDDQGKICSPYLHFEYNKLTEFDRNRLA